MIYIFLDVAFKKSSRNSSFMKSIGVRLASSSYLCGNHQETVDSIFFLCPFAMTFLDWFERQGNINVHSSCSASTKWTSLSANSCYKAKKGLGALFIVAFFSLWKVEAISRGRN
eukprot:TRINITY_DN20442_c0_g1_i3.p1 TRINITY_DN20442_c0_g1~~TRINITY_DN20442_c0_g1_i3.p1  ORF type:complete len:114 (-),score=13.29 TRINITY_DN20442_c0_g1_i3:335-676(-)